MCTSISFKYSIEKQLNSQWCRLLQKTTTQCCYYTIVLRMWTIHELFVGERGVGVNDGGSCCCRPPGSLAGLGIRSFALFFSKSLIFRIYCEQFNCKNYYFSYDLTLFEFFHCFSPFYDQEQIAPVALCSVGERFAHIALYKRATMSDLLRTLFKKMSKKAIFSGRS